VRFNYKVTIGNENAENSSENPYFGIFAAPQFEIRSLKRHDHTPRLAKRQPGVPRPNSCGGLRPATQNEEVHSRKLAGQHDGRTELLMLAADGADGFSRRLPTQELSQPGEERVVLRLEVIGASKSKKDGRWY
jgi:hypothetical protein